MSKTIQVFLMIFYFLNNRHLQNGNITFNTNNQHKKYVIFAILKLSVKKSNAPFCKISKTFAEYFLRCTNLKYSIGRSSCSTEAIFVTFKPDLSLMINKRPVNIFF